MIGKQGFLRRAGRREDPLEPREVARRKSGARGLRAAAAAACLALASCAATQPSQPHIGPAVSSSEEARAEALFRDRAARFRQASEERVGAVGARLLPAMGLDTPVGFQLLDSSEVNAYARGGTIYVTVGMMRFTRSDDELALVLGHEMGHLAADRQAGTGGFSPEDRERIADYEGLMGLHRAGYDMVAACEVWQRMATELMVPLGSRQAQGAGTWTLSHPSFAERSVRAHKLAESLLKGTTPPTPAAKAGPDGSPPSPTATHSLR